MSKRELKPCYFCGIPGKLRHLVSQQDGSDFYIVHCTKSLLGCRGKAGSLLHNTPEEAIDAWNKGNQQCLITS